MNDQRYVILSLELLLFFSRIMKEHSFFLEDGFTLKDSRLAKEADFYKNEFEKLLSDAVDASNGIIRSNVLNSGEIVTNFTLGAERKTEKFTGARLDTNITKRELQLCSGKNPRVSSNLVKFVCRLNARAQKLLRGLIRFKQELLEDVLSCKIFTLNYPLLIDHVLREARLYFSLVNDLENGIDIDCKDIRKTELFWDQIMMEHAEFIRGLLDPTEEALIATADDFAHEFKCLIKEARAMTDATIDSITDETLDKTIKLRNFKKAGTEGISDCKIRSIILPLLADHVLREANHYIRLLETYEEIEYN